MHDGQPEVLIIDGLLPVLRLVLLVEVGIKVEQIPVGVGGVGTAGVDLVGVGGHEAAEQVGADLGLVHLALKEHGGTKGVGLGVVGALDGVNEDVVLVPVCGVLGQHLLDLGLEVGQDVCAAVEQFVIVDAEGILVGVQELTVDGHEGAPAQHGQKVGAGGVQGVDQGVVVSSLYADVFFGYGSDFLNDLAVLIQFDVVAVLIHPVGGGLQSQQVSGVIIVVVGVGHLGHVPVVLAAGIVVGVQDVVGGVHPVVGLDLGHFSAGLVHPFHALADVEGPLAGVGVGLPAFGQRGLDHAVAVILDEGVHHVGGDAQVFKGGGGQVVHGLHLAGVELAVGGGLSGGGIIAAGSGASRAVRVFLAAAGSQTQAEGTGQTEGSQTFGMLHVQILLSFKVGR